MDARIRAFIEPLRSFQYSRWRDAFIIFQFIIKIEEAIAIWAMKTGIIFLNLEALSKVILSPALNTCS